MSVMEAEVKDTLCKCSDYQATIQLWRCYQDKLHGVTAGSARKSGGAGILANIRKGVAYNRDL